ncbi:MAG: Dam family site-specific DNA-(adenine-N6)-methyltransferase [Actinobacteria bacterium]|nr:Dam family site-specific DNA-(adenine-N6)-methyltransferase [Actinomycetota bacterium]
MTLPETTGGDCSPLLRWAGGKQRLARTLGLAVPRDLAGCTYHEPFLGAGSLFLHLNPRRAVLADANAYLVDCMRAVRDHPQLVARYLSAHGRRDCADYYYEQRALYNRTDHSPAQAARFIYLNRTGYNGVFRVNQSGSYNVPYGHLKTPRFPTVQQLYAVAARLNEATLLAVPFEEALSRARRGDFVYLDPPYPPLNGTAFFAHYTPSRFPEAAQRMLASTVLDLHAAGIRFLMSNADIPLIRDLYRGFNLTQLPQTRSVSCKSHKLRVADLLITNYDLGSTP